MIRSSIIACEDWFAKENRKSAYLAFLRVAMSLWLLKELLIDWSNFEVLYSNHSFIVREDNTLMALLPGALSFVRDHYMTFIYLYIVVIILNILGVGRWITATVLFVMLDTLQKLNTSIVNGGDNMARLVLLYLIFASSYDYFVLYKTKIKNPERKRMLNMMSNAAAYSLMLQLCLSYLCSGLGKLTNELWKNGTALYYTMSMDRFTGTPWNKHLAANALFVKIGTYYTLVFEIAFSFLVWINKFRKPFIIAGLLLHLFIYVFMMLYGFEEVFILLLGLFLTNDEALRIARRCKRIIFRTSKNQAVNYAANS